MVSEDPPRRGFLLIFRRGHGRATHGRIVTAHVFVTHERVPNRCVRVFQHIASCTHRRRRREGQHPSLCQRGFSYLRRCCYYSTHSPCVKRSGHFCLTPHVAMRTGLYLHPLITGCLACSL